MDKVKLPVTLGRFEEKKKEKKSEESCRKSKNGPIQWGCVLREGNVHDVEKCGEDRARGKEMTYIEIKCIYMDTHTHTHILFFFLLFLQWNFNVHGKLSPKYFYF